ncbi:MAG: class I SAM-dependent methyltransferase [Rubrobacter sp.]
MGGGGAVVFADISRNLLDHSRNLAKEMGMLERCRFVEAPANDLPAFKDESVDAVTTRSVLIYVKEKRRAFQKFHRVLKPGGRLSIFEPINNFRDSLDPDRFLGYNTNMVADLASKLTALYRRIQPPKTDPMLDFDERDLFEYAERAGFNEVRLTFEANIETGTSLGEPPRWEQLVKRSGNPNIPTLEEAMPEALTPDERERFAAHLKPLVEANRARRAEAGAYLRAVKDGGNTRDEPLGNIE